MGIIPFDSFVGNILSSVVFSGFHKVHEKLQPQLTLTDGSHLSLPRSY